MLNESNKASHFYIRFCCTAWGMKLSAAISEAFLTFPGRDRPVCRAVPSPVELCPAVAPCNASVGFSAIALDLRPAVNESSTQSAGSSRRQFGVSLLGCEGRDTRGICRHHPLRCLWHRPAGAELLLRPCKQAATKAPSSPLSAPAARGGVLPSFQTRMQSQGAAEASHFWQKDLIPMKVSAAFTPPFNNMATFSCMRLISSLPRLEK